MKYSVMMILCLSLVSLAGQNGLDGSQISAVRTPSTDNISLTLLSTWSPVTKALGLDVFETAEYAYILGTNNEGLVVQGYETSGAPVGSMPLSASNSSCFGVAWNNNPDTDTYYTSDWNISNLFYTENFGTNWTTVPSPAGSDGRGMDFDGTHYWMTNGTGGGLWRFQPGSGQTNVAIPQITAQPSGVTVFPYGSNFGVAVTSYTDLNIWFYEWNGSSLDLLGSASCPASCSYSYGLAYSEYTGTIFWSYSSGSTYYVSEVGFDISSLQRDTWGGIKAAF
jgi:hypothetical protein